MKEMYFMVQLQNRTSLFFFIRKQYTKQLLDIFLIYVLGYPFEIILCTEPFNAKSLHKNIIFIM